MVYRGFPSGHRTHPSPSSVAGYAGPSLFLTDRSQKYHDVAGGRLPWQGQRQNQGRRSLSQQHSAQFRARDTGRENIQHPPPYPFNVQPPTHLPTHSNGNFADCLNSIDLYKVLFVLYVYLYTACQYIYICHMFYMATRHFLTRV
jgi:hypothetical protein